VKHIAVVGPVCRSGCAAGEGIAVAFPFCRSGDAPGEKIANAPPFDRSHEAIRENYTRNYIRKIAIISPFQLADCESWKLEPTPERGNSVEDLCSDAAGPWRAPPRRTPLGGPV